MARALAIDYGKRRVGIAVTDELQIIANPLRMVEAKEIFSFLKDYCAKEDVECFVVGEAFNMDDTPSESAQFIEPFVKKLAKEFPTIPIARVDERYSSKRAVEAMVQGGMKKSKRRIKGNIDKVSAAIILQDYLLSKDALI